MTPRLRCHTAEDGTQTWYWRAPLGWELLDGAGPLRLSDAETQGDGWSEVAVVVLPEGGPVREGMTGPAVDFPESVSAGRWGVGMYAMGIADPASTRALAASLLAAADASERLTSPGEAS